MDFSKWKESLEPYEEVLPSGLSVKLKNASMQEAVYSGLLPVEILKEVVGMFSDEEVESGEDVTIEVVENMSTILPVADAISDMCVVKVCSKVKENGDKVYVNPGRLKFVPSRDLKAEDKIFIMNRVTGSEGNEVALVGKFPSGE